ncbi:MAG: SDR family oxidoreductase [Patescibacteria group bacterium]|jgi:short-subunit dehydrogenase
MLKNILIVGGTSGLGLELTKIYSSLGHTVTIAGRKNPNLTNVRFVSFSITSHLEETIKQIDELLSQIEKVNTLIYTAGFYQSGHVDELSDTQITEMVNINLLVPALMVRRLKNNPGKPLKVMLITSSSQYTPRELEPMYTSTKAALGMLGASLSLDLGIGKVLVVAPSGMKTPFWKNSNDTSEYLEPKWVAEQVVELSSGPFKYRYAKILRNPQKVEIVETRQQE